MAAGVIAVPTIIPLIAPSKLNSGTRKGIIDTSTLVELHSSMPDCVLFYTLDGTKPDPFKKIGLVNTYQYQKPFTLPPGKQTLKALAVLKDGTRESLVNTKIFQVAAVKEDSEEDELSKTSWKVQDDEKISSDPSQHLFKKVIKQNFGRKKTNTERHVSDVIQKVMISSDIVSPPKSENVDDLMHCFNCGKLRSDLFARFCSGCSSFLTPIPGVLKKKLFQISEFCATCGATGQCDSNCCSNLNESLIQRDFTKYSRNSNIVCKYCGSTKSKESNECIVCDKNMVVDKVGYTPISPTELISCALCQKMNSPYAKFCTVCKSPLPKITKVIQNELKISCPKCASTIPYDSKFCNSCGENLMLQTQTSNKSTIICKYCRSTNSAQVKECVVCEESLIIPENIDPAPNPSNDDFVICPSCKRINSADARYCDWCGSKPHSSSSNIRCAGCLTINDVYAGSCYSCKKPISTPIRKSFEDKINNGDIKLKGSSGNNMDMIASLARGDDPSWREVPVEKILKNKTRSTFTQAGEGLLNGTRGFKSVEKISPGNGYWRQQIDHISQQLKVYTQNNIAFRDSFSNCVLSSLHSAEVHQSNEEDMLSFVLKFGFNKDKVNKSVRMFSDPSVQTLKNAIAGNSKAKINSSSPRSRPSSAKGKANLDPVEKKITKKSIDAVRVAGKLAKLSPESLAVLKMVTSTKPVDEQSFEELVNSANFDPNSVDENEIPLLKLCVLNKKFSLLQLLIDAGANVDQLSGYKENSALHESVSMGISGQEAVEILLLNKSSPDVKNKKGKSAYDLAIDSGIDGLISKFTKHTSNNLLKDIIKI